MRPPYKRAGTAFGRGEDPAGGGGPRALVRRATLRPEVRAAMALEEAGELQEAARVFEYAGEHAQAAALRLEIARTLRDPEERIDVLREGCARTPTTLAEGRMLHEALADAILELAEQAEDIAIRRALQLEAARALEEADQGGRAGELYESLGLLGKAASAYERGGEVARLELVLELLERKDQIEARARAAVAECDRAIAEGRRRHALELLREHLREREHPRPELLERLDRLESRLVRGDRVELRWRDRVTSVRARKRLRIGRAPDADLVVPHASLSREHAELRVDASAEIARVIVIDAGSASGTFWDGEPLVPGEPFGLERPGTLGLGAAATIDVEPIRVAGHSVGAMLRVRGDERIVAFLPAGGPLWLDRDIRVPARLLFEGGLVVLDLGSGVAATLGGRALVPGATIELMLGDRVALRDAPLQIEVIG